MAKVLIGNVKPVKGVDYFTPADIEELGENFATQEDIDNLTTEIEELDSKYAPKYLYGTADADAGVTLLETGKLYFVYEE